ncbi:signal peptidase complex subunit 1 [Antechinus flavipes]|uniref:signal peptidase complex subunit 1 n=1 Tax=Antechinus flavipes TaxID=38775 RepID=UPI00223631BE|nr:signal peptidase complex subunit 1 [Antechinus flavipes]
MGRGGPSGPVCAVRTSASGIQLSAHPSRATRPQPPNLLPPPPPSPGLSNSVDQSRSHSRSPKRNPSASLQRRLAPKAVMLDGLSSLPTQMDYKGQKLAEQMFQGIILFSAVIGFIYGYVAEQFGWTVYIVMAGFAFSCLLTLPPWPIYRRHPLKWLPVQDSGSEDKKPAEKKIKRHPKNN